MPKRKKWTLILVSIAAVLLLSAGSYIFLIYHSVKETAQTMHEPINRQKSEKRLAPIKVEQRDPVSFLLIGVDERANDIGRSDTLIVVTVNPEKKSMKMVSIPRDTRTKIIGKDFDDKINHAYAYGGVEMAIASVEHFLNIPVDYYIKVNMEGFQDLVNAVGGVTIQNPFSFSTDGVNFPKGSISLNGEDALTYARMRYEDPRGDFGRQDRQKQIIKAIIDKGASFSSLTNYEDILNVIGHHVKTNLTFAEMKDFQQNYKAATSTLEQLHITGNGTKLNGIYYLIVPEEKRLEISDLLRDHLGLESP